ncbi:helix-turn-helix transcriptional regulator [Paenibacillus faecis]|uniref:Helix-turn-helix transcriptional regulator n=1 Tax=Paenibacillus faecis TaxID=862114 RepID=A0A5D0CMP2_9BACL|nr:helix-turn-helix transcriptional regulator [Paenibacillus faecis]TYA10952.1 helix-turn-helix transcriptional regulator [Paenibacillus faecis]
MSIGKNIKTFRKEKKLTQVELAKKANMSRSYLADVEGDRYNPSLDTLSDIAEALGVSTADLLHGRESFGKFIRLEREMAGLSLEEVCRRTGINETQLSRIENEDTTSHYFDVKTMKKLAEVLNVSYVQLYEATGALIDLTEQEKKEFFESLYKEDYINEQVLFTLNLFDFTDGKNKELLAEFINTLSELIVKSKKKFTFSINLEKPENYQQLKNNLIDHNDIDFKSSVIEALSNLALQHKITEKINPLPFKTEREFIHDAKIDLADKDLVKKYPTISVDGRPLSEKELRKIIGLIRMDRELEEE